MPKKSIKPPPPPPCEHRFVPLDERMPCLLCGCPDRPVISRQGEATHGICEACTVHVYWAWRSLAPDVQPVCERVSEAEGVRVVLSQLVEGLPSGATPSAEARESYKIAMVKRPDGGLDLPAADLSPTKSLEEVVVEALDRHGIVTWGSFVEPLYAALSPRGRLARVVLVTAYTTWKRVSSTEGGVRPAEARGGKIEWKEWPPWEKATDLAPLYLALRDVWPLLIWRHGSTSPRTTQITTPLRRAAAEYVYLQEDLRKQITGVDASAAELLRRGMSEDEKLVEGRLAQAARRDVERREQAEAERAAASQPLMLGPQDVPHDSSAGPTDPLPEEIVDETPGEPGGGGSLEDEFEEEPS